MLNEVSPRQSARIKVKLARVDEMEGRVTHQTVRVLVHAARAFFELGDPRGANVAMLNLCIYLTMLRHPKMAARLMKTVPPFERPHDEGKRMGILGHIALISDSPDLAQQYLRKAIEILEDAGSFEDSAFFSLELGVSLILLGTTREALEVLATVKRFYEASGRGEVPEMIDTLVGLCQTHQRLATYELTLLRVKLSEVRLGPQQRSSGSNHPGR